MERRTFLKTTAGIATAATIGTAAFSQTGAAAGVSIGATNPTQVSNDRGDLTEVNINPNFTLNWEGFDDAVGKVFYLVEAKVGEGGDYQPIFRATPWLAADDISTTGSYAVNPDFATALNQDDRFSDGEGPDISASPLVVADEQGKPDYEGNGGYPGSFSDYESGVSVGSASNYPGAHEDGGYQNNYWDIDAGYYGAAADTSAFDNDQDDSSKTTQVFIRYTFELQRPNLSQLKYHVDFSEYSGPDVEATEFTELSVSEQKRFAAEQISGLQVEDIDDGNSALVMNGEDGYPSVGDGTGITYEQLRTIAPNHPGVLVEEASFNVRVRNEQAQSSGSGSTNAGASGSSP